MKKIFPALRWKSIQAYDGKVFKYMKQRFPALRWKSIQVYVGKVSKFKIKKISRFKVKKYQGYGKVSSFIMENNLGL